MVANWSPWGKPGNGAPKDDIRLRNLQMDELYPVAKNVHIRNFGILLFVDDVTCFSKDCKILLTKF